VSKLVFTLGVVILLMGMSIGVAPEWFLGLTDWESRGGQNIAASIRVISGLALMLGAPASRYPTGLRVLGAVVLLAGLVLLVLPHGVWVGLIAWFIGGHATLIRVGGGVGATLLGLFLVHASRPKKL
jgi:hypothetical protein